MFVLATGRDSAANFLEALIQVYFILILAHIILQLVFSFGGRIPYSRWSSAAIGFLRDVVEPYLSIFRRFIPQFGMFDFSPIIAIFVLQIVGAILVGAVRG